MRGWSHEQTKQISPEVRERAVRMVFDLLAEPARLESVALPRGLKAVLRPYQHAGLNWLCFLHNLGFGPCLADDMGLGKTVQVLTMLQHFKERGAAD